LKLIKHKVNSDEDLKELFRLRSDPLVKRYLRGLEFDVLKTSTGLCVAHEEEKATESLTLESYLSKILSSGLPDGTLLLVDVKKRGILGSTAAFLSQNGIQSRFNVYLVSRFHNEVASIGKHTAMRRLLSLDSRPQHPGEMVREAGAQGVSLNVKYADRELVEELKGSNYEVFLWIVEGRDIKWLVRELGLRLLNWCYLIVDDLKGVIEEFKYRK